jgi:hypothetical protein
MRCVAMTVTCPGRVAGEIPTAVRRLAVRLAARPVKRRKSVQR